MSFIQPWRYCANAQQLRNDSRLRGGCEVDHRIDEKWFVVMCLSVSLIIWLSRAVLFTVVEENLNIRACACFMLYFLLTDYRSMAFLFQGAYSGSERLLYDQGSYRPWKVMELKC